MKRPEERKILETEWSKLSCSGRLLKDNFKTLTHFQRLERIRLYDKINSFYSFQLNTKLYLCFTDRIKGCPTQRAEIIPIEPDAGNAAEGKR